MGGGKWVGAVTADSGPLTPEAVAAHSTAKWIGAQMHCLDAVDSTNTRVRELGLNGAPDGTVVFAEEQSSGRGRLGRTWVSPRGRNVYASILLRSDLPADQLSQISLTAGLAACEAVGQWCDARLKWPNDVLVGGRKVVGILAELESRSTERFVVLGIGVNVNLQLSDLPPDLRDKAGSIAIAMGELISRSEVAGTLLSRIEARYDELRGVGFGRIAEEWGRRAEFVGKQIRVAEPGGIVEGEVVGLASDGALCLKRKDGQKHKVLAGDVTVLDGY